MLSATSRQAQADWAPDDGTAGGVTVAAGVATVPVDVVGGLPDAAGSRPEGICWVRRRNRRGCRRTSDAGDDAVVGGVAAEGPGSSTGGKIGRRLHNSAITCIPGRENVTVPLFPGVAVAPCSENGPSESSSAAVSLDQSPLTVRPCTTIIAMGRP